MIGARRLFSSLEHVFRTKKGEQKQYESNTQKKWMIKQWNFGYFFFHSLCLRLYFIYTPLSLYNKLNNQPKNLRLILHSFVSSVSLCVDKFALSFDFRIDVECIENKLRVSTFLCSFLLFGWCATLTLMVCYTIY